MEASGGDPVEITVTYTVTPEMDLQAYRAAVSLPVRLFWMMPAVLMVAVGLLASDVFAVALGIGFAVVGTGQRRRAWVARHSFIGQPLTVTLTAEGIDMQRPDFGQRFAWRAFRAVERSGGWWVFRRSLTIWVALPESVLNGEQTQQLEGLLRQRSLLPA
jgi:hypothetical protein